MQMIDAHHLLEFAKESNRIEGITANDRHFAHREALNIFLNKNLITIGTLEQFVHLVAGAKLRTQEGDNVWIGGNQAPPPKVSLPGLDTLLMHINNGDITPWRAHCRYEHLHPFMDGNGRSGRALWLWMMCRERRYYPKYKFLQMFYYQTLQNYKEGA